MRPQARLRAIERVARVGTNGDMFRRVIQRPLISPMAAAPRRAIGIAAKIGQPLVRRAARITAVMPQVDPTDKSIPPVKITAVIPIATMPTKEKFRVMLTMFSNCLNWGIATAITRTMRTSAARVPPSRMAKNFDKVEVWTLGLTDSGAV